MSQENSPETETQDTEETESPDLDSLLSEYESSSEDSQETTETKSDDDLAEIRRELKEIRERDIRKETRQALDEAVSQVKEFGELEMDDFLVEGAIHKLASENPKLVQAFQNRGSDPDGFKKVLKGVADTIKSKSKTPDKKLTEDSEAVRAAVRGQGENIEQGSEKPDPAKLRGMTNREFEEYKRSLG